MGEMAFSIKAKGGLGKPKTVEWGNGKLQARLHWCKNTYTHTDMH